jgi:hypothetical protein
MRRLTRRASAYTSISDGLNSLGHASRAIRSNVSSVICPLKPSCSRVRAKGRVRDEETVEAQSLLGLLVMEAPIVTDGSLPVRDCFARYKVLAPDLAFDRAVAFIKWGRHWTWIGWAGARTGPH